MSSSGGGSEVIIEMEKARRTFGGLVAVNDVDMKVQRGSILAIIGPNGAGKTTFFNGVTAITPLVAGRIVFEGTEIQALSTHAICRLGIARTFQNIRLFPYLSVLDNVKIGTHTLFSGFVAASLLRSPKFYREEREIAEFGMTLLEKIGLADKADFYARNLSYGDQRKLEIVRAMASRPKLLLLDEPAAGMNNAETAGLERFIRRLKDDGFTIIIIEHDMRLVMSLADTISVLDHGEKIAEGTAKEIQSNQRVIEAYLGKQGVA